MKPTFTKANRLTYMMRYGLTKSQQKCAEDETLREINQKKWRHWRLPKKRQQA